MQKGWIKLHRQIQANSLWYEKPFDKARAWIDLLLLANYEDKKTTYKGEIIVCERGTVNLSVNLLAQRWGWSRHKVSDFLDVLEKDNMLEQKRTRRRNVITIVNYDFYQCDEKEKDNSRTSNGTNKGQVTDITKKEKNKRNNNNVFTPPTFEEVTAYCRERNNDVNPKQFFDYFQAGHWIDSEGKPVRNWKQKLITWEKKGRKPQPQKAKTNIIESHDYDFAELERILQ